MAEEEKKPGYEFSIAGFKLKLNSAFLAMAIPIATTVGGAMWGAFEFYQDYVTMKKKIANYVAPDLSVFDKRLAVIEENSQKSTDYTRDIKNDLKQDIRRIEGVVEQVERNTKQSHRDTDQAVKESRDEVRQVRKEVDSTLKTVQKDTEREIKTLQREVDDKIKKALDNPLSR